MMHRSVEQAGDLGQGEGEGAPTSADAESASARDSGPSPFRGHLSGANILLVDDDDDGRDVVELVLREYGARVRAVSSASEAVEALRSGGFDVLVSDIGLPIEDGYALMKRAREVERFDVPALALTAYTSPNDVARALASGFDGYIVKPIRPEELVAAVRKLIVTRRDSSR